MNHVKLSNYSLHLAAPLTNEQLAEFVARLSKHLSSDYRVVNRKLASGNHLLFTDDLTQIVYLPESAIITVVTDSDVRFILVDNTALYVYTCLNATLTNHQ